VIHRRRRETLPVNAEINLTNLIDIAFVLLIIFMITAPIMQDGVPLKLPKADVAPVESSDQVTVSVTREGKIFVDKAEVSMADLSGVMQRYAREGKKVAFRADEDARWGDPVRIMAIMNKAGITDFGIIAEPEGGH
jgi:biopolymer transport protein ExbD